MQHKILSCKHYEDFMRESPARCPLAAAGMQVMG